MDAKEKKENLTYEYEGDVAGPGRLGSENVLEFLSGL